MVSCTYIVYICAATCTCPKPPCALYLCARPREHAGSSRISKASGRITDDGHEQRATGRRQLRRLPNSPNLKQRKTVDARAAPSPQYVTRGGRGQNMSKSFAGLSPSPPSSSRRRPSRTRFMDVRSKRVYTGPRQPHQSRMKMYGLDRKAVSPGPGQYNPGEYTHKHSPRFSFGKAPQRVEKKKILTMAKDPWEQAGMGRSLLASSMGYQPESTSRSAPSVSFGSATRDQARLANMPKQFADDRNGFESPGPIYYPQPSRSEMYRRFGVKMQASDGRKTSLVREQEKSSTTTKMGAQPRPTSNQA